MEEFTIKIKKDDLLLLRSIVLEAFRTQIKAVPGTGVLSVEIKNSIQSKENDLLNVLLKVE